MQLEISLPPLLFVQLICEVVMFHPKNKKQTNKLMQTNKLIETS